MTDEENKSTRMQRLYMPADAVTLILFACTGGTLAWAETFGLHGRFGDFYFAIYSVLGFLAVILFLLIGIHLHRLRTRTKTISRRRSIGALVLDINIAFYLLLIFIA